MNKKNIYLLTQAAMIAALYVVLTFIANAFGLANYSVQVRFSEALTILPFFTPAAIPGLFIGCLISNILTGCAIPDIIFGSLATLIAAFGTWKLRGIGNVFLSPLPPILANTIIVPFVLRYAYGIRPLWLSFLTVGAGEIISCGILGLLLAFTLNKYRSQIFRESF
ncbi:MAG TPA: QueT transporter family protein [Candidatus Eisenbergiella intestinigallinarum]|uniref:QueT transporter family protein n=1 Tax=Candidatus Eisenbergiella intestinigallinarum TaxID=2838549 RepID=A0A9D2QHZ2_9FIRM|nr:QueT transporter family protein [Candidatus Eisenbergiella intestinigallinarum]